jgi:hypothetical protein
MTHPDEQAVIDAAVQYVRTKNGSTYDHQKAEETIQKLDLAVRQNRIEKILRVARQRLESRDPHIILVCRPNFIIEALRTMKWHFHNADYQDEVNRQLRWYGLDELPGTPDKTPIGQVLETTPGPTIENEARSENPEQSLTVDAFATWLQINDYQVVKWHPNPRIEEPDTPIRYSLMRLYDVFRGEK